MGFTGLDGGIMVALAAGLWLVYLLPTWFRRREYAAVERTAIRRQQAMRVLQETAPIPAVKRAEQIVSPTGQVADRAKLAEAIKRSREAQAARESNRRMVESTSVTAQATASRQRMSRRLRRTRAVASILLVASLVTIIVQVSMMITGGIAVGAWSVLGFSAVVGVVSFAALGRLASIARKRAAVVVPARQKPIRTRIIEEREAERPAAPTWTPVPLPKPLYLSRTEATPVEPSVDPAEQLRLAALESDRALRAAQESSDIAPITEPAAPLAPPSRYAAMGIVDKKDVAGPNLDEVLRRRRAS
jgi:hypothetical protein